MHHLGTVSTARRGVWHGRGNSSCKQVRYKQSNLVSLSLHSRVVADSCTGTRISVYLGARQCNGANAGCFRREVSQSLSVTHSTLVTGSIIPGDRYRNGIVIGRISAEQNRQDVRSRGVFTDCSSDCAEVSPSDERVTKYDRSGILRTFLTEYHNTPTSERARLVWSATHEQARCHVKHTFEARRVLNSYHIACLSMSSGAYVYAFQAN